MSHSLTCPFSCLPACLPSSCPWILVVLCCRPLPPLPPDVLNYFIRYYSPPTTTPTVLTPSGTQEGIPLHFVQPYCRRVKADWLGYILFVDYLEQIAHTYGLVKLFYNGSDSIYPYDYQLFKRCARDAVLSIQDVIGCFPVTYIGDTFQFGDFSIA